MKRILVPLLALLLVLATACQPSTTQPRGGSFGSRVVLASSAAHSTAFTGPAMETGGARTLIIELDITAVTGTTPTLDVKVQTLVDGTNWCDVAAFTQRTTGTARQLLRITSSPGTVQAEVACTDGTLAAATIHQGPFGSAFRIKHATPGGTATPTYTYSVTAWAVD